MCVVAAAFAPFFAVLQITPSALTLCGPQQEAENKIMYERLMLPLCSYVAGKQNKHCKLSFE